MKKLCRYYLLVLFLALSIFQVKATSDSLLKSKYDLALDLNGKKLVFDLQINVIQPTCAVPTGTITVVPDASSTGYTYSINGTNYFTSGTFTNLATGDYTVTVKNASGAIIQTTSIAIDDPISPTISLTSVAGTDFQSPCEDIAIETITYAISQGASATVTGLPNGVTANFASGVLTISGIPAENGAFPYTITTVSGCKPVTRTGILRVQPATKIALSSAIGTDAQIICIGSPITDITYQVTNASKVQFNGLPAGVVGNFFNNVVTLYGTPTEVGMFNYTISTTGECQSPIATGTITIGLDPTITLTSGQSTITQDVCEESAISPVTYAVTNATGVTVTNLPLGVNYVFNSGELTISGTPHEHGTFQYTITTIGSCKTIIKKGLLRVAQATKIILTSGIGTDAQTTCINAPITNITYDVTHDIGNVPTVQITGLPAGVTGNFINDVVTISGTPTISGTFTYTISATSPCQSPVVTGTITVQQTPTITLSVAGSDIQGTCEEIAITPITYTVTQATDVTVTGLPNGVSATFTGGILTISGIPTENGLFTYIVTTVGGCIPVTTSGQLRIVPATKITLTSGIGTDAQTTCINSTISNITYDITNANNVQIIGLPAGITGNFANNVVTISGTSTIIGKFTYTISATGDCQSPIATGTITINQVPTITLTSVFGTDQQSACEGVKITDISYKITDATGAVVTGLPNGVTGNYVAGIFTITGTPTAYGIFPYTVTTTGGCSPATSSGVLSIKMGTQLILTTLPSTAAQVICIGKPISSIIYSSINATNIIVTGLPTGLTSTYLNGTMEIEGTPSVTGSFNYTVTAVGNCVSPILTGKITISELPTAIVKSDLGSNINKGDIATLSVADGSSFTWMPTTGIISGQGTSSILVRPDETTTYTVEVSNATGCSIVGEITLVVNPIVKVIPGNIITPNGNGENDYWTIKNIEYFPNNNVKIYDRAGRLIYNKKGYKNDWDATYNGKPLNEDAYLYVIDLGIGQGLIRGTITIIRSQK
ncbi:gliding motility-associated C-terminal domain-containing protein [Pedobacter boryungensis]|uniref:Gliding motility-associated C-terminal domain-containing protein n=1 Tax=Pedobacter boryungensis TaxID=869962 RepID=A0ABX2DD99_9SPHI|nr:gliding motility-associated C-terminal domain-containing protein [Pedobacter boryungensis]NQX31114.1 gliding motility-associated C-terminal domain-containing protein [Pedobacter boryungensis]